MVVEVPNIFYCCIKVLKSKFLEQGKKFGLTGEKVDSLKDRLDQNKVNLKSKDFDTNKLYIAIEFREKGEYQEAQKWDSSKK